MVRPKNGEDREEKVRTLVNHRRAENTYRRRSIRNVTSVLLRRMEKSAFQNRSPSSRYSASFASAEADAHVASEAFCQSVPTTGRRRSGNGWSLHQPEERCQLDHGRSPNSILNLSFLKIEKHLRRRTVHCERPRSKVIAKKGEETLPKSWMWVYSFQWLFPESPIRIFFKNKRSRKRSRSPKSVLKVLKVSGNRWIWRLQPVENTKRALCWAHVRGSFSKALPSSGKTSKKQKRISITRESEQIFMSKTGLQKLEPAKRQSGIAGRPLHEVFLAWQKK
ncbi:IS66 family transposase [Dubosiella newyorkensis]|uniref:IS66 family transposase n=1 Tax=Dubosiella newyorkensis TaxID=1862672 RepID=UPI003F679028